MTNRKTKFATAFNVLLAVLNPLALIAIFIGYYVGLSVADIAAGDAFGGAILFSVALFGGGITLVVGTILSIVAARMYKKDVATCNNLLVKYLVSTVAKLFWATCFVFLAIYLFIFGYFGVVIGVFAALLALINLVTCVFDWISRKELV